MIASIVIHFHHPCRLHPDRDKFFWSDENKELFRKFAGDSYLPALKALARMVRDNPGLRLGACFSGIFLEQAELHCPEVINAARDLLDSGLEDMRVEILGSTFHYSPAGSFPDPRKIEFRDQVVLHQEQMTRTFGVRPRSFLNTGLLMDREIACILGDMGYGALLCDLSADSRYAGGPETVLRLPGRDAAVVARDEGLSLKIIEAASPPSPDDFCTALKGPAGPEGGVRLIVFSAEFMGLGDEGRREFWDSLPAAMEKTGIEALTPEGIMSHIDLSACPEANLPPSVLDLMGLSTVQHDILRDIYRLESDARRAGGELQSKWRNLASADSIFYLEEKGGPKAFYRFPSPYEGSAAAAVYILTRKLHDLETAMKRFEILKRSERTAVLMISPETGKLPDEMGPLARYISGKSGGQGEVVSALCEGLTERGIEVHLATLNLKKRFQQESRMTEDQWREVRYKIYPEQIHLVSSAVFAENMSAYSGDPRYTAAEFQREIVNNIIKSVRAKCRGRLIVHSHDWMAGGAISAYARVTGLPLLHTVHNIFTGHLPLDLLYGVDLQHMSYDLYLSEDYGRKCIDCQATAIKDASLINFVGEKFLREVVDDYFLDRNLIPPSVRREVKAKYHSKAASAIINAPSPGMYPEKCPYLVRQYGPDDSVLEAKRTNLVEFQKRTGLSIDPDAILFYWPSRLDPSQKGVELLEDIALKFVIEHSDVQIAIVGDGVGGDRTHVDILGRIAVASGGRICLQSFSEELSMLGYAAAGDVFGASLYEPCGQIDQVGNLFGATATNRDTGGYHDKIRELMLKAEGAPQDVGNGFLFRDYDSGGLWYAMHNSVLFHRMPAEIREAQAKRIMRESRERYDLQTMIARYMSLYERLNGGKPLG
jgi:glycogen synthase